MPNSIASDELHLQKYRLADYEPASPDEVELNAEHAEFARKHERSREAHERVGQHHVNIVGEIEKLLQLCESGM